MKTPAQIVRDCGKGNEAGDEAGPAFTYLSDKETVEVRVEFRERKKIGTKTDLLAKAIGAKEHIKKMRVPLRVLDATAGLCRDSFHMASLGCEVVALEENQKIFEVVNFYVSRLPDHLKFLLIQTSAQTYFDLLPEEMRPDVVYLDPMFPEKKKSAKSGKETELLKQLVAPPSAEEESALLLAALRVAKKRVVVKRPLHAPELRVLSNKKIKPQVQFKGRAVRYDVYLHSVSTVS